MARLASEAPRNQKLFLWTDLLFVLLMLASWGVYGLALYTHRMTNDISLLGVGASFGSAGLLSDIVQRIQARRQQREPQPEREPVSFRDWLEMLLFGNERRPLADTEIISRILRYTGIIVSLSVIATLLPGALKLLGIGVCILVVAVLLLKIARLAERRGFLKGYRKSLEHDMKRENTTASSQD